MKKKLLIFCFALVLIFSAFVYAFTLVREVPVALCWESDLGLNENVVGSMFGQTLGGQNFNVTDYCLGSSTLIEYSCSITGGNLVAQAWTFDCDCLNGFCL